MTVSWVVFASSTPISTLQADFIGGVGGVASRAGVNARYEVVIFDECVVDTGVTASTFIGRRATGCAVRGCIASLTNPVHWVFYGSSRALFHTNEINRFVVVVERALCALSWVLLNRVDRVIALEAAWGTRVTDFVVEVGTLRTFGSRNTGSSCF